MLTNRWDKQVKDLIIRIDENVSRKSALSMVQDSERLVERESAGEEVRCSFKGDDFNKLG